MSQHDRDRAILWARERLKEDFVVLDTETTGLDYDDEAVSIGLIDKQGNILLDTLLCHEKKCHPKALKTHGIIWEMTREAPTFAEVWPRLVELTKDKVLIIYNAEYDTRIIEQMIERYGISVVPIFRVDAACAMQAFAIFYGDWSDYHQSYTWKSLSFAAYHFDISTDGAHGAVADALMTLRVVEEMARAKLSGEEINVKAT